MTASEFNSKINLPSICMSLGIKNLEFKFIPSFGWYAHNVDRTIITDLWGLFPFEDRPRKIYRTLTQGKTDYQASKLYYSEVSENKLFNNYAWVIGWQNFYIRSRAAIQEDIIKLGAKKIKIATLLEELGLSKLIDNQVGFVSENLYNDKTSKHLGIPEKYIGRLCVPTFNAPGVVCSIDLVDPSDLENKHTMYVNKESGWAGQLGHTIVGSIKELGLTLGNTWDKKCDVWNNSVVNLSTQLSVEQCIKIWIESKQTLFNQSPLALISDAEKIKTVQNHIKALNLSQVKELEKTLNIDLNLHWQKQQEEEISFGNLKFIYKDQRYYINRTGTAQEYTNFGIKLVRVKKTEEGYQREGTISFNGEEYPFEMKDSLFRSPQVFLVALKKQFLQMGIGIPFVLPNYKHYLVDVIHKFNPNVKIEN